MKGIAQIHSGTRFGTAWLVAPGHVMTAAHCIDGGVGTFVQIHFRKQAGGSYAPIPAVVRGKNDEFDAALLELQGAVPAGLELYELCSCGPLTGQSWHGRGFPASHAGLVNGLKLTGQLIDGEEQLAFANHVTAIQMTCLQAGEMPRLRLEGRALTMDLTQPHILAGVSGGPVCANDQDGRVVGLIRWAGTPNPQTVFASRVEDIAQAFHQLLPLTVHPWTSDTEFFLQKPAAATDDILTNLDDFSVSTLWEGHGAKSLECDLTVRDAGPALATVVLRLLAHASAGVVLKGSNQASWKTKIGKLLQLAEVDLARQSANANLGVLTQKEAALQVRASESEGRLAVERARNETYQRTISKQRAANEGLKRVIEARAALTAARKAEEQAVALTPQIDELGRQIEASRSSLSILATDLTSRDLEIAEKQARLSQERDAVDQLAHAVAVIVSRLKSDDTVCPVCSQQHPPGVLPVEGHKSVARWNQGAARLVEEFSRLVAERDIRAKERARQQEELKLLEARLTGLQNSQKVLRPSFSQLMGHYGLQAENFATALGALDAQQESLTALLQQIQTELATFTAPAEFEAELVRVESEARRAREERDSVSKEVSMLRALLETHTARLSSSAALINGAGGVDNLVTARGSVLRSLADKEAQVTALKAKFAVHEEKANEAKAKLAAARVAATEARLAEENRAKEERAMHQVWDESKLGIEATIEGFHDWRGGIQAELQSLERAFATVVRAVEGLNNWLKHEELRTAEQLIRETVTHAGCSDEDEYAKRLDREVSAADQKLKVTLAARNRAEEIAGHLKQTSDSFSKSALEPLSERITEYMRLISPFDFTYEISPHLTDTRAKAVDRLGILNMQTGRMESRDPDLWLSEGQQAVLGLSVLLGASTAYRWSRWRALLLDDPLQNADLVHATAFADVVRGLVRDEGYQIMISTHDYDEADFLERKCKAWNIPVQKITLLSLGPAGVRHRVDAPAYVAEVADTLTRFLETPDPLVDWLIEDSPQKLIEEESEGGLTTQS